MKNLMKTLKVIVSTALVLSLTLGLLCSAAYANGDTMDQYVCCIDENIEGGTLLISSRKSFARDFEETTYPEGATECPSDPGDPITVTITPDDGYVLTDVYVSQRDNVEEVYTQEWWGENTYTFWGINTNMTVHAVFNRLDDCVCKANIFGSLTTYYKSVSEAALEMRDEFASTTATFTMLSDTTEEDVIEFYEGTEVSLDLDGYAIIRSTSGPVIENRAQLEIKDSNSENQTHNFEVDEDGLWTLTNETEGAIAYENLTDRPEAGTIITVTGGCITGGNTISEEGSAGCDLGGGINNGGNKSIETNVLTLTGGNIIGNKVTASSDNPAVGGGVFNKNTFIMNGGTIAGNLVCGSAGSGLDNTGGGVHNDEGGVFTLEGGSISYNTSTGDNKDCSGFGGGVYTGGTFTMSGATISYNTADRGGGIFTDGTTSSITGGTFTGNVAKVLGSGVEADAGITLGGNVTITGHKNSSGTADNVFLYGDDALITIQDGYTGTCGVRRYENSGLGVISTATDETYLRNFKSDNNNYGVHFNDDSQIEISDSFAVDIETVTGGTVTANKTSAASAATITLTATPDEGYVIDSYEIVRKDTGEVYAKTSGFSMPKSDVSVKVTFTKTQVITNNTSENGSITINDSGDTTVTAKVGSEVTLAATPNDGYALNGYSVYKTGDAQTTVTVTDGTFTMPDYPVTVTADFVKEYSITIGDVTGHGSISADKSSAKAGETVTLTVTPDTNYEVSQVKVNDDIIEATDDVYSFTMPSENVEITATFVGYGNLTISTSIIDKTTVVAEKEFTFTLTLTDDSSNTVAGSYSYTTTGGGSGTISSGGTINLKAGESATISDLPADINYEVTETEASGFSIDSTNNTGVISVKQTKEASFENTYTTAGSVNLIAKTTLTVRTLQNKQFKLQLLDSEGDQISRSYCNANGDVTFDEITYDNNDAGKTFTYYIREVVPNKATNSEEVTWANATEEQKNAGGFSLEGYTYDSTKRKVTVTVSDNGDGTMTATPTYYDTEEAETDNVIIANTYAASSELTIGLTTTLKARTLKAKEFTFGLYDGDGITTIVDENSNDITTKNTADGTVSFRLSFDQDDIGKTFTYVIKQIIPDEGDANYDSTVVYDDSEWKFEVTVVDKGNGTLSLSQKITDEDNNEETPVIANTLKPGSLTIKNLIQAGDSTKEFNYIVKFVSPDGDDLDGDYEIERSAIVPIAQLANPSALLSNTLSAQSSNSISNENITPKLGLVGNDIASGTCGTCNWVIDGNGCLTISAGTLESNTKTYSPWDDYRFDITSVVIEKNVVAGESINYMFNNLYNLTSVTGLENLNTANTKSMQYMFYGCSSLKTLDLSGLNTTSVTTMSNMFYNCSSLEALDLSNFNTANVTTMANMFNRCSKLKSITFGNNFNTAKVTMMTGMFLFCSSLKTLNLSGFNTTSLTSMNNMFAGCTSLESLNLFSFNTSKVKNMNNIFGNGTNISPLCTDLRSVTLGSNFSFKVNSVVKSTLPTPDESGYTGKWVLSDGTVEALTAADLANAYPNDTTAPAGTWVWEEGGSYTLKFDANDGLGSMDDQEYDTGVSYTLPANTFYKLGKTFSGWNTEADGTGTAYADGASVQDLASSGETVTLYAQWVDEDPAQMTENQMQVTLRGNESLTLVGVPAGTQYLIYEQTPSGWVLVNQSSTSGVISPLTEAVSTFTNNYVSGKTQATIVGTVTISESAGKVNDGDYSFVLKDSNNVEVETISCGAGGSIAFSPITYEEVGTYIYTVSQVIGNTDGIIYDEHIENVTVTVTDDGQGNLSAVVEYDDMGLAFANEYETVEGATYEASLSVGSYVGINIYIKNLGDGFNKDSLSVTVDGAAVPITYDSSADKVTVTIAKVNPAEMDRSFSVCVEYEDEQIANFSFSVLKYCNLVFNAYSKAASDTANGKLCEFCKSLLNYGKYAIDYANEINKTGKAASTLNSGHEINFDEVEVSANEYEAADGKKINIEAAQLVLNDDSTITIKYYVKSIVELTAEDVVITNADDLNVRAVDIVVDKYSDANSGANYVITFNDISVARFSREYTLTVPSIDSKFSCFYSVYTYCDSVIGMETDEVYTETLKTLCKSIYSYGQAAKTYVEAITKK